VAAALAAAAALLPQMASAQDSLKLAVGQRGNWASSVAEVGQRAGIFKKHGLTLDLLYTQGSGETQQAVIAESVDIGIAAGTMGAMSAFAKGAPVRIIGAETTGASDLYWYVKASSPIKTIKDFDGKTIAFSTVGSSTHGVVTAFVEQYGLKAAKPTQTGGPAPTLTAVMSGQVDVGWAAPPFGLDQLDRNEIRQIATGNDTIFKGQTVRLVIANLQALQTRKDAIIRYMRGYRETVDWMYSDPAALKTYAGWTKPYPAAGMEWGWFTADTAIEGLKVAGANPTQQSFITSLRKVTSFNHEGLTCPVDYSAFGNTNQQFPGNCTWMVKVKGNQFVSLTGTSPVKVATISGTSNS